MAHLLLLGTGRNTMETAALLCSGGHTVTLAHGLAELPRQVDPGFDLIVAETGGGLDPAAIVETTKRWPAPWLSCTTTRDTGASTAAYKAGALAVLPWDAPPDLVQRTVERLLATLAPARSTGITPRRRWQRHYRPGERILLDADSTLEVREGVVALTVIHADGAEVLLGLYGPGQILAGHPEDTCCIQLYAHAAAKVQIQSWPETVAQAGSVERFRDRLRLLEAWAAMQARPQIEQRLLGILSLLAEQFGRVTARGTLIDVRITHAQLASAVGATRATVTRRLGMLRRRGLLAVAGAGRGERYCLPDWAGQRHSAAAG